MVIWVIELDSDPLDEFAKEGDKSGHFAGVDFVNCDVMDYENKAWMEAKLIFFSNQLDFPFICDNGDSYKQCRIKMFSKENPPPIDTLVKVKIGNNYHIRHFARFYNGGIEFFINGRTSKTDVSTAHTEKYSFIGFPKSDYELY